MKFREDEEERAREEPIRGEKEKGFWKKRVPAKIFPRKFCGLKIYPYVCSAKT